MPDIASVREKLGVAANRTLPDGTPYHTLPAMQDPSTEKVIGDSFEIALYLDRTYTDSPRLVHPGTTGLTAAFNAQVDGLFTKYVALADQMPHDARVAEKVNDMIAKRFGATAYEDFKLSGEAREKMFVQFENALGEFVKAYYHVGGTTDYFWSETGTAVAQAQNRGREESGPYLEGDELMYADLIVGAWLAMLEASMKPEDWQRVRTWQDGFWARLHDALAPLREIK
ncbi:hypothetical protein PMZ80_002771 [Knufia obscura]|nr:hypothetical protein PMZ80_002771 [Knufia obscura]